MTGNDVREKYLKFFEKHGHKRIKPAALVLKDDPTTLFTSAGMQPLVPYLLGKDHKDGKRLVDSQPCFRAQDIEDVGDDRHDTLFEMLGNWSLGDYFKEQQIPWMWEFFTKELGLSKDRLYVTIFEGNDQVPEDTEAYELWTGLGVVPDHIFKYGVKKNWWARTAYVDMPVGEPGGPSSEVFYEFTEIEHNPKYGEKCHPNCDCGRFIEIGNSVFMTYKKTDSGFELLEKKNIDFGGGLERMLMAVNNTSDMFENDLHFPIIETVCNQLNIKYEGENKKSLQIIADHVKAATFIIVGGILPGNKLQSYLLRRLIRRVLVKVYFLTGSTTQNLEFKGVVEEVFKIYDGIYLDYKKDGELVEKTIKDEADKFSKNLDAGIKKVQKTDAKDINEKFAFDLMQSEGFPFEITAELAHEKGIEIDKDKFDELLKEHQEKSRQSSSEKFKIK